MPTVRDLRLESFKAFERFTISFGPEAYLVGPNNAGKSTVISALRAASAMLRRARARRADTWGDDGDVDGRAWSFDTERVGLVRENLRHEFRGQESRFRLTFSDGSKLTAVWPVAADGEDDQPFFNLVTKEGQVLSQPVDVRRLGIQLGLVPVLTPVEHQESRHETSYVKEFQSTRRASRHFRNQLLLLKPDPYSTDSVDATNDWEAFLAWAEEWSPDFLPVELEDHTQLDLFCREEGRRTDREIYWAGDGFQIWLQVLLHVFRLRGSDTVILDEPDVFLHADLQRRLVRLLSSLEVQTIMATHSSEVLSEAAPEAVVWLDKSRRRAVRSPSEAQLGQISASMGSRFNLQLARALRAKIAVFVEGDDMALLRHVARTVGALRVANEFGVALIPLEGFDNWEHVEPFKWLVDQLLGKTMTVYVLLDRDYRSDAQVKDVVERLRGVGVKGHVWRRKELENYFLSATVIARIAKAPLGDVERFLAEACEHVRLAVVARRIDERRRVEVSATRHAVEITEEEQKAFEKAWRRLEWRLQVCPGKEVLKSVNRSMQSAGFRAAGVRAIAREMTSEEVPSEMAEFLLDIESALDER